MLVEGGLLRGLGCLWRVAGALARVDADNGRRVDAGAHAGRKMDDECQCRSQDARGVADAPPRKGPVLRNIPEKF